MPENFNPELTKEQRENFIEHASLVLIRDRKVFLIQRPNEDDWQHLWALPSETLEPGETPEQAARRIGPEELGTEIELGEKMPVFDYNDHRSHLYRGTPAGEFAPNPGEVEDFGYFISKEALAKDVAFGFEKVIDDLRNGDIID